MNLKMTTAQNDEYCHGCGYPFDAGDMLYWDGVSHRVYCSKKCASVKAVEVKK